MPVPSNSNDGTLGRGSFDTSQIQDPAVRKCFDQLKAILIGMGWPSAAQSGDSVYQAVYAQFSDPDWTLYAGKPSDPTNPDVVSVSAAGSALVDWYEEGVFVASRAKANVTGDATVTDSAGDGWVVIDVTGGGGTTYSAGDGLNLAANVFSVVGYEGIVVDGNGVSVDYDSSAGLMLDASGASGKLQVREGKGIAFDDGTGGTIGAVIVDIEANKGLEFSADTDAGLLRTKIGTGIQYITGAIAADISAGTGITVTSGYIVSLNITEGPGIDIADNVISASIDTDAGMEFTGTAPDEKIAINDGKGIAFDDGVGGSAGAVIVDIEADKGLEFSADNDTGKLRCKEGTYIDINSNGINVDLTEVLGYDAGQNQYLKNEAGTLKWVTASECS